MSFEDYLLNEYNQDQQDIDAIERVLVDVARVYDAAYDTNKKCWPYDLRAGQESAVGSKSIGTPAMILAAVGKIVGCCTLCDGSPARAGSRSEELHGLPEPIHKSLLSKFGEGLSSLIGRIESAKTIESDTFGANNPLSVSNVTELARATRGNSCWKRTHDAIIACGIDSFFKTFKEDLVSGEPFETKIKDGELPDKTLKWSVRSAFLSLKALRAAEDTGREYDREPFKNLFEQCVHEHLSFSSIPDSRFDPAELAFSLEGLLICARETVDPMLFDRVLAVLAEKQVGSAYWRPNRPFIAKQTGEIILPLSVEGANSLVRSVAIVDETKLYDTFAAKAVPLFRRFWQWLRARQTEFNALNMACRGWRSEHINETGVIDLWDTSQIVEFLLAFRHLLQRHIARQTLVLSRVQTRGAGAPTKWCRIAAKFEPLRGADRAKQVFVDIGRDFIEPWLDHSPKYYSMLLYGPPGTGKTTVARNIAEALGFRLITVTVSDFLGAGGAMVEARAKAIFQMLEAQSACVILFDEIDAFLLDRDSKLYREQDTLFQFLTPGMLTKINDLRAAKRSIFIIATNYANRIDPAVKRPGRIDRQYLLMPPDLKRRERIIRNELRRRCIAATAFDDMARASLDLGYSEIVGEIGRISSDPKDAHIVERLASAQRSGGHEHYLNRLGQEAFPAEEFLAVAEMAGEADKVAEINETVKSLPPRTRREWNLLLAREPKLKAQFAQLGIEV